ncbi:TPA_asm: coat protein [ssRNA phage Gerhypos.4_9]|uniref:Coat protein n=2 Tax=Leviviricetes TaxID=2842243 RepID=A0A8S5KY83_9VIRU|nr:coat protein [ssRNA phage Gerhypos.4_9]QDH90541.1 MAG: hypothetical protein H4Bulk46325_000002 [Leviviridae sp.]DAD50264.1 TPA_asm: coat protein [ssRNA phage Gerhypos.4_9]
MFADPQSVTINSVAKSLVKINQDQYSSEYALRTATEDYRLRIRNTSYRPKGSSVLFDRHNAELVHTVFATSTAPAFVRKTYVVVENQQGDTLTDPGYIAQGLFAWLTSANVTKLMNFES